MRSAIRRDQGYQTPEYHNQRSAKSITIAAFILSWLLATLGLIFLSPSIEIHIGALLIALALVLQLAGMLFLTGIEEQPK